MQLAGGYVVEDSLVRELVDAGRRAHEIALDHATSPGSNGFTFGADRYHRACELAVESLEAHGFVPHRLGAGVMASRGGVTLAFATARGRDLADASAFDPDSSQTRRRAIQVNGNALQGVLDLGLPAPRVFHVVWCGTPIAGLSAVMIGSLIGGRRSPLRWADLRTVYDGSGLIGDRPADGAVETTYSEQPAPDLVVRSRRKAAEGDQ